MTPAALDRIAERVHHGPGFDVSPRGVTPREDPELEAMLAELGDEAIPELRTRLEGEPDPFLALSWLRALLTIGTPAATQAVEGYAQRLRREDPFGGAFPGSRELLLFLGR